MRRLRVPFKFCVKRNFFYRVISNLSPNPPDRPADLLYFGGCLHSQVCMTLAKIGKLIFHRKAILMIALCLFLNGIIIGLMAAGNDKDNFLFYYISISIPYIFFFRTIRNNITEVKQAIPGAMFE